MAGKHVDRLLSASPAENYEQYFVPVIGRPLADDLLRRAALKKSEQVLDVGCGTGVVTRLAAERVGPKGKVVGLDINPEMLAVAKSVTPAELAVEWQEGSADAIRCADESFDAVLCQLSLQFVPDRGKALREIHRVLVPGGRLVLNVPGPAAPLFETLADAMRNHIAPEAAGFVKTVFSLHEEPEIEKLLEKASFQEVDTRSYTRELSLPASKDFLWQYVGSTPLAGVVASRSDEALSAMEDEVVARWAEYEDAGGLTYRQRIVMASAVR